MRMRVNLLVVAVLSLVLFSSCVIRQPMPASSSVSVPVFSTQKPDMNQETQGTPLVNQLIARGKTKCANGMEVEVRLVMREGEYLTGDQIALGGGLADENYIGICELQIWNEGEKIDSHPLQGESEQNMIFNYKLFEIKFADYNMDGNFDFNIGQWVSSVSNAYSLFTVQQDGTIAILTTPYAVFASDGKMNGEEYSLTLTPCERSFVVSFYNNATGEMQPTVYRWDDARDLFLLQE